MTRYTLALLALLACGGDDPTGPQTGSLIFVLDPTTCVGQAGNIRLFIDSQDQGVYTFSAGDQRSFTVTAGTHTAGAIENATSGINFGSREVTVPANGSFTLLLQCP